MKNQKIHIVCKRWRRSDRIVPRLSRNLAKYTGWSIGETFDPSADFNYAGLYLGGLGDWPQNIPTKTGAWFSHYPLSGKRRKWIRMAEEVDLRTTCVPEYFKMLQAYGSTAMVTPGMRHDVFNLSRPKTSFGKWTIGTAGFVTEGDRKGPDLAFKLYEKYGVKMKTVGRGWLHPHETLPSFTDLVVFYHDIEVFVCTSRVEGIHLPTLEALACGTKVVIPYNVGVLDQFGEQEGVRYYETGRYHDMLRALNLCLSDRPEPEKLNSLVSHFTYENWAETHKVAIGGVL